MPLSLAIGIENWQHSHIGNTFSALANVGSVKMVPIAMLPVSNGDFALLLSPARFPSGGADGAAPSPSSFVLLTSYFARKRGLTPAPGALELSQGGGDGRVAGSDMGIRSMR